MLIPPSLFALAYVLDWLIGDPLWLPHPVRLMGRMIRMGEKILRRGNGTPAQEFISGAVLSIVVVAPFALGSWWLLHWLKTWSWSLAFLLTLYLSVTTLATRSLLQEAQEVQRLLREGALDSARIQVARIVGRDTQDLDESEITRAVIETVAESTSDGIVAPLFYLTIGGVPAALAYKAINTLDSIIGHRGVRYEYFGKFAARLDDVVNFVPARITALLLMMAAWTMRFDWRNAWQTLRSDAAKHSSPNAGQPEAAMAGALGVQLGGTNYYDAERHDGPTLGVPDNRLDDRALSGSLKMMICASCLMFALCFAARLLIVR